MKINNIKSIQDKFYEDNIKKISIQSIRTGTFKIVKCKNK